MKNLTKTLPLLALLAATPAVAQDADTTGETPAAEAEAQTETAAPSDGNAPAPGELSMGQPAQTGPRAGQTYIAEEFGDWQMRCVRTESENDPCQLYQLLEDQDGNSVAEISIFGLPEGQQAAAGATIVTPLETLLTPALTLAVDDGQAKRYPYTFCSQVGCFARIGFTGPEVAAFKRGAEATLTIVPAAAPDQQVDLTISLSGFTAGYEAVNEANAETQ